MPWSVRDNSFGYPDLYNTDAGPGVVEQSVQNAYEMSKMSSIHPPGFGGSTCELAMDGIPTPCQVLQTTDNYA